MFSSPHTSPSVFFGSSRPTLRLEFTDFHTLTYEPMMSSRPQKK